MARTIIVQQNQSILDVIIQGLGSMEAGWQFCVDNDISISDVPEVGMMYVVSDAAILIAGAKGAAVLKYLVAKGIVVGTLNKQPATGPVWGTEDGVDIGTEDGSTILVE